MNCELFARLIKGEKKEACIFGAGLCGRTWGYEMLNDAGFQIVCYIDNHKDGQICNGYAVKGIDYLSDKKEIICFVAVVGKEKYEIIQQLEDFGIKNVYCLPDKEEFLCEFAQYIDETSDHYLYNLFYNLMDDKLYLQRRFKERMGYDLDIDNPRTFNEKLQWLKIYDRKPIYTTMVDKAAVKKYISDRIGSEYVIPTLGIYDSFDDIDFESLPSRFVLKCTHDSGSVIICKDKNKFDFNSAKEKLEKCLTMNYFWPDREWPYYNVPRKIIAEEFIDSASDVLDVYKIFNFLGKPELIQVIQDDKTNHETIDYFDTNWNLLELRQNFPNSDKHKPKPECLEKLLSIAKELSKGFPFVRTDMYISKGKIFFSEFTFFTDSGSERFYPEEWDIKLGKLMEQPFGQGVRCNC